MIDMSDDGILRGILASRTFSLWRTELLTALFSMGLEFEYWDLEGGHPAIKRYGLKALAEGKP